MPHMPIVLLSAWSDLKDWLEESTPDIVVTVGVLAFAFYLFKRIFPPIAKAAIVRGAHPADQEAERRADTITSVVVRTMGAVFIVIGVATILTEFGVNITAIVAGLGIAGVALGLGAQQFVRDAINGIFLLAEDQYRRGDVIKIADVTGTVEDITIRRTVLRDIDGVVHSVPNGSISVVSNYTRDYALVNLPVRVAYGEDLSRVEAVVNRVGAAFSESAGYRDAVVEPPRVSAVEEVGDGAITVTVSARTQPSVRWNAAAELRRLLAEAFVTEGIRVPFASVEREESSEEPKAPPEDPGKLF